MKAVLCFALLISTVAQAAENTPADFTIGTQVVNAAPQRFGLNVLDPLTNNHLRDSGSEPVSIRRHMVATGGSDTTILVQAGASDLDYFTTLGNGFFQWSGRARLSQRGGCDGDGADRDGADL